MGWVVSVRAWLQSVLISLLKIIFTQRRLATHCTAVSSVVSPGRAWPPDAFVQYLVQFWTHGLMLFLLFLFIFKVYTAIVQIPLP